MADLNLQASESVLMSEGDELYLTNLNIISIETIGFFKTKTVVNKYPLSQVKKVDGVPQVLLKDNLTVQVFFWQDQITLEFEKNRVAEEWANNIRAVASGNMAEFSSSKKRRGSNGKMLDAISTINPDAGLVIDAANSALGALADVITKRDKKKKLEAQQTETPRESVSAKCKSCGAPISGIKGSTVRCAYCGTEQVI